MSNPIRNIGILLIFIISFIFFSTGFTLNDDYLATASLLSKNRRFKNMKRIKNIMKY